MEFLAKRTIQKRADSIIDGTNNEYREDGYTNMLTKYGTQQDSSTAYEYMSERFTTDMELAQIYEGNGLFSKIIDRPAEECVKHGLDIDYGDTDTENYVEERLDELDFETKFSTAEKWARLYGGAIIVMFINDGRGLEEPVNYKGIKSIDELMVFERAVVSTDLTSIHNFTSKIIGDVYGEPKYFIVSSIHGYFRVHRSRCLVFHNGCSSELTQNENYRYWGEPEYVKIRRALRECITTHENGTKMLERSVQAIYKMRNLSNLLSTADGEEKVIQRLQVIDMARNIINSIAIDNDGEDYDFKSSSMNGVAEIVDTTCQMLSAVTNIPQTILFGRSPSGMNATGQSDFENYYNMVENIQKQNIKKNVRVLIDIVLKQAKSENVIKEVPKYKVKFKPLWSMTEQEQEAVKAQKASTAKVKAEEIKTYLELKLITQKEARKAVAELTDYGLSDRLPKELEDATDDGGEMQMNPQGGMTESPVANVPVEEENVKEAETENADGCDRNDAVWDEWLEEHLDDFSSDEEEIAFKKIAKKANSIEGVQKLFEAYDKNRKLNEDGEDTRKGVGVLIFNRGKILVGDRDDGRICGPGGHVQDDETVEEGAVRETQEEFGITPKDLIHIGHITATRGECPSDVYATDRYTGELKTDDEEMFNPRWVSMDELEGENLFPPFKKSLDLLLTIISNNDIIHEDSKEFNKESL